jgi:hypothetical protein
MSNQPNGVRSGDLLCIPIGPARDGKFQFIPGAPTVEVAQLMSSPVAAQLSLQAAWRAEPEVLQAAERAIQAQYPDVGGIDLQPAEFDQPTASLTVTVQDGPTHTFGPNPASGMGQQRVVFNDRLTSAEKTAAIAAFHGQSGILTLTYQGRLHTRESSTVKIAGDLAPILKALAPQKPDESSGGWFGRKTNPEQPPPLPDLAACTAALDDAISSRRIKLTRIDTANVSDTAKDKAEAAARGHVAKVLFEKLQQMGADAADVSSMPVTWESPATEDTTFQISRSADLGEWLGRNAGPQHVTEVSAPIAEPPR